MEQHEGSTANPSMMRFLLVNGILLFGVPLAIITAVFRALLSPVAWLDYLYSTPVLVSILVQAIVGGLVFGLVVWFLKRRAAR